MIAKLKREVTELEFQIRGPVEVVPRARNRFDDVEDAMTQKHVDMESKVMQLKDEVASIQNSVSECLAVCQSLEQKKVIETSQTQKLEVMVTSAVKNFEEMSKMLKQSLAEHQDYCLEKNLELDQKSTNLYKICGELNHWRHHTTTEKFGRLDEFLSSFGVDFKNTLNKVNFMDQDKIGKEEFGKLQVRYQRLFQDVEEHMLEQRDNQKTLEHYCEIYIPIQI